MNTQSLQLGAITPPPLVPVIPEPEKFAPNYLKLAVIIGGFGLAVFAGYKLLVKK